VATAETLVIFLELSVAFLMVVQDRLKDLTAAAEVAVVAVPLVVAVVAKVPMTALVGIHQVVEVAAEVTM
jgi:hypothetical protein